MYFTFLILVALLFLCSYIFFDKDIMEPAVLLNALFLVATSFALYLYKYWNLNEYGTFTVVMFMTGLVSFSFGDACGKHIVFRKKTLNPSNDYLYVSLKKHNSRIDINPFILFTSIIIVSITALLFFRYFFNNIGMGTLGAMLTTYKSFRNDYETVMPAYLNILIKISTCFAHIALIVFINNVIVRHKSISDSMLLFFPIVFCLISFFSANRGDILCLFISGFFAWFILLNRTKGWKNVNSKIAITKGIKYGTIVLVLFWAMLIFTGRASNSNDNNIFTYLCSYISGPLASFDLYLKQGGVACTAWGEETFCALNNNLYSLFGIGKRTQRFLEFRHTSTYSTTNIYSSFRRFYHDFNISGVVALSFFQGLITSKLYKKVKYKNNDCCNIDFGLIVYCYFSYTIIYVLTDDLFYSSNISISGLSKLVILCATYFFFFLNSRKS